jgi:hydrogenase maturation protease
LGRRLAATEGAERLECAQLAAAFSAARRSKAAASCAHSKRFADFDCSLPRISLPDLRGQDRHEPAGEPNYAQQQERTNTTAVKNELKQKRRDLLIIGYGNTLRRDDGVGPRVADTIEALRLPGVRTLHCALLTPELAEPVSQASAVIFVDAAVDAPREVQMRALAPAETSQVMAHAASPATLLALARDVFGRAPEAWWLTIPVEDLGIGEEFSVLAQRGFKQALEEVKRRAQSFGNRR